MAKILRFPKRFTRDELVEAHAAIVRPIAVRLAKSLPPCFDIDDLVGAGNLGLLSAAGRYSPALNDSFEAFARQRIRGAMLDSIKRKAWANSTMQPLEATNGGEDAASYTRAEVAVMPTVERDLDRGVLDERLWLLVAELPPRLRTVIELRFRDETPVQQIGLLLGCNSSRVSELTMLAVAQLRTLAQKSGLKAA